MKTNRLPLGWFPLNDWGFISIYGKDHLAFVQALISNDVIELKKQRIFRAALLEKNSQIIASFWVSKAKDRLYLFAQKDYLPKIKEKFEQFIFTEEVALELEEKDLIYIQGPKLPETFSRLNWPIYIANTLIDDSLPLAGIERLHSIALTADEGVVMVSSNKTILKAFLAQNNIAEIDKTSWETFRVEAGLGLMGVDFNERYMLLEVDATDEMISSTKGCYPGQETVARTLSRGSVKKKLFGLKHQDKNLRAGDSLYSRGKQIADIKSTTYSPSLEVYLSLVFLKREYWFPGKEYRLEKIAGDFKSRIPVTVANLPFYLGENLLFSCNAYLEKGLNAYHKSDYDKAKHFLYKALTFHPRFAEAVEAIAVIEERLENIEGAIELNKRFSQLDPNAVMAHSNLSRLYMKKGWIEKAEEEQKQATLLGYKYGQSNNENDFKAQVERQTDFERQKKIKMFQSVLSIDPKDEIAHFGLGKIHYQLKKYREAATHLKIVVEQNPKYSAAYDILGKSLVALEQEIEAKSILTQGIEVASKLGDLTPKKSMEEQLRRILLKVSSD